MDNFTIFKYESCFNDYTQSQLSVTNLVFMITSAGTNVTP